MKEARRGTRPLNEMFHAMMDDLATMDALGPLADSRSPASHGPLCWCGACSAAGYGHLDAAMAARSAHDNFEDGRSLRRVCAAFDSTEAP